MSGATPGPWHVVHDGWKPWAGAVEIQAVDGTTICWTPCDGNELFNAQMLAAATDMIQAAERVLKWVEPISGDNRDEAAATEEIESVAELRAAISRARLEHKEAKP